MLTVTTNLSEVITSNQNMLNQFRNPDKMLRTMATTLTGVIRKRVHEDGISSTGEQIGTYSEEYMKVRTGNYGNSGKYSRGANKGKVKDSGVFTRGAKKGQPRLRYNRTADTKVIGSLTRQMENDFGTNETDPIKTVGGYGIGFKNPWNYEKSQFLEISQRKRIWGLTAGEEEIVIKIADKFVSDAVTGENS